VVHGDQDALQTPQAGEAGKKAGQWVDKSRKALIAALAGALAGGCLYLGNYVYVKKFTPTSCPAGCVTSGSRSVSSDQGMQAIEDEIAAENKNAIAGPYYSVALLDPFVFSPGGTITQKRMTDELQGAYLALKQHNESVASMHKGVVIQLLLANEGTSAEEGESAAVQQIKNLQGPDRIVAVAGMGLSNANTEASASDLSADSMPMFGAVTTGDQLTGGIYPGLFEVPPDVAEQVAALVSSRHLASSQPIALIGSDQQTDIYSTDLRSDFSNVLGYTPGQLPALGEYSYDPATAEQQFAIDATTICTRQRKGSSSLTVLYAGRAVTLPTLVGQFQQASTCRPFTVTIVTGSDSNVLQASVTSAPNSSGSQEVTVVYSDIESVDQLSKAAEAAAGNTAAADNTVAKYLTGSQGSDCANKAVDPWEIATYNSVMAAAVTVSQAQLHAKDQAAPDANSRTASPSASPTGPLMAADVLSEAVDMENSSSSYEAPYKSSFGFDPSGDLLNPVIPIYSDQNGTCSLVSTGRPAG
jgi:hypothetical protein